jgi:predicted AlkP superfamily pyrophosphatase or phosphodiesterase
VVMLFDGMGQNIVRLHLKDKDYIRSHYLCTINSTFPPTTTAATLGFLTGKYPIETGWMSWTQYFEEYKRNIILFKNVDYNTDEKLEPNNIAETLLPTKSI